MTKKLAVAEFEDILDDLWRSAAEHPPERLVMVDYGQGCLDAPRPSRPFAVGDKVRVRLELPPHVQCRPGVIGHIDGHMGPGYVWVQFPRMGAWFEHDKVTLEEDQPL